MSEVTIEFRPVKGGMISDTRRKSDGGKFGPEWKTETAIHPNLNHAAKHLKKAMRMVKQSKMESEPREKKSAMRKG